MKDYQDLYGKTQQRAEAQSRGFGRLESPPAVAGLGLVGTIVCNTLKFTPPTLVIYAVWATAPIGLLLFAYGWFRAPVRVKFSMRAAVALVLTVALGAATLWIGFVDFDLPPLPIEKLRPAS